MRDIAAHILDMVKNSLDAGADQIKIRFWETETEMGFTISDNGEGMSPKQVKEAQDPFFSTKNKKTGLGISLLKQNALMTGGKFAIASQEGEGTVLTAVFVKAHPDCRPKGDVSLTIETLRAVSNAEIFFEDKIL